MLVIYALEVVDIYDQNAAFERAGTPLREDVFVEKAAIRQASEWIVLAIVAQPFVSFASASECPPEGRTERYGQQCDGQYQLLVQPVRVQGRALDRVVPCEQIYLAGPALGIEFRGQLGQ
jgi:hypothetical protein